MKNLLQYLVLALFALQVASCSSCDKNSRFPDPVRDCGCPTNTFLCSNDSCYCPEGLFNNGYACVSRSPNTFYSNVVSCIYNGEIAVNASPNQNGDENYGNFGWSINAYPGGGLTVPSAPAFSGSCKYIVRPEGDSIYNDFIPTRVVKAGVGYEPIVHGHFSVNKDTLFAVINWYSINTNSTRGGRVCRHGATFIKHH